MSDAVGGAVNLALIVFFVVVIALYMAFSVNYQKAFNVKNKIVSVFEEYNGRCDSNCMKEIEKYEASLGYGKVPLTANSERNENCPPGYGFCVSGVQVEKAQNSADMYGSPTKYCYFEIRTQVEVDIPVINNVMGLKLFQVTGQTQTLKIIDSEQTCEQIAKQAK